MKNREKIMVIVCLCGLFLGGLLLFPAEEQAILPISDITLHKEAKKAIYDKDWDRAVQLLQKIDSQFPGSTIRAEALYWQAYSLEKQGKKIEAIKLLNRLLYAYKDNQWLDDAKILRVRIAADLVKQGLSQYHQYIIAAVQTKNPEEIDLKMMALDALLRLDRHQALPVLEKLYKENKDPEIRENIIFILRRFNEDKIISQLAEPGTKTGIITIKEIKDAYTYQPIKRIVPPKVIRRIEPDYPKEALEEGVSGDVTLKVIIDKKGEVLYAVPVKGAHPLLAEAAEKAVKQWKFFPYTKKGKRMDTACILTINFALE